MARPLKLQLNTATLTIWGKASVQVAVNVFENRPDLNNVPISHPGLQPVALALIRAYGITLRDLHFIQHCNDMGALSQAIAAVFGPDA